MTAESSEMKVTHRKTPVTEESFEKIGEEVDKILKPDEEKTSKLKGDTAAEELKTEPTTGEKKKYFPTILRIVKELLLRIIVFCIVYLIINRFYKIFQGKK